VGAACLALLLFVALPAAAAAPEKPGAAIAALQLPACDYRPEYWTPEGSLSKPLAAGDYAAVEAELEELHRSFERNHACERRMAWAFEHGFWFSDDLPAQLDRWVAARPQSWTAHTIRGATWKGLAWQAPDARSLREASERAAADLERAIELKPQAVVAHGALIELAQVHHDAGEAEARYRRAIAIDPLSVYIREKALTALQPAWGGSLAATERIVAEARAHEKQNPRVARVYGYPDAWRALDFERRGPKDRGERKRIVAFYTKALRYGEASSDWHYRRVMHYRQLEQWEVVAADAAYGVAADPKAERFWSQRLWALAQLGRHEEALAGAREALAQVPGSVDLRWYEANVTMRMGRYDEAAALHRAALADTRTPHQRFIALGGLGESLLKAKRYAEAEPVFAEATEINPRNTLNWHHLAEARWRLGKRAEAVPAYEHFLELSEGAGWADEMRMRAQEKIDVVRSGAPPAKPR
jgi:tetratricopeptide (TPR) repeat protein